MSGASGGNLVFQYVLEGSIRRAAGRIHISAQLLDVASGNHLWAERYDRGAEDVFEVQNEVTRIWNVAWELEDAGAERAKRKHPESLAASGKGWIAPRRPGCCRRAGGDRLSRRLR
jgi:hypothetical protein